MRNLVKTKDGASAARAVRCYTFFPFVTIAGSFFSVIFLQRAHYIASRSGEIEGLSLSCTDTMRGGRRRWLLNIYILLLFSGPLTFSWRAGNVGHLLHITAVHLELQTPFQTRSAGQRTIVWILVNGIARRLIIVCDSRSACSPFKE
jgi:hypothetical protein